jgi:hypothetical protein
MAYRELVRLHTQLSDEAAAYQNEIQALVVVLFPEFTQIFADPCLPSALAVLRAFRKPPRLWRKPALNPSHRCCGHRSRRETRARRPKNWSFSRSRV